MPTVCPTLFQALGLEAKWSWLIWPERGQSGTGEWQEGGLASKGVGEGDLGGAEASTGPQGEKVGFVSARS